MHARPLFLVLALALLCPLPGHTEEPWQARLNHELPLLGHRNWIVIADSAYPLQTAIGIETIETGGSQLDVVRDVLFALSQTKHVKPIIYVDSELAWVAENDATGIGAYRVGLRSLLATEKVQPLPHEQIIGKLNEAGQAFHVLVLKTNMTIPYTSVFLQLDCAYWSPEAEQRLREAMKK